MRILCRTPVRITIANGGDTDYYIEKIGWGCVINATLSTHFYEFEINDLNHNSVDIIDYFNNENPNRHYHLEENVSELELYKATLKALNMSNNHSFIIRTNVPMHSGLGGSSSLNVAMLAALFKYKNEELNTHKIAHLAYHIERNLLNVPGGYQDQFAAAYGKGFNYMEFKDKEVGIQNLKLNEKFLKKLEQNIFLYYVNKREQSGSTVHNKQKRDIDLNSVYIKRLLIEKRSNVLKMLQALKDKDLDMIGNYLKVEGEIKSKIIGDQGAGFAKDIIKKGLEFGATGYKVSGAGGGGCVMFYVPTHNIDRFNHNMERLNLTRLNFRFQRPYEEGIQIRFIK